MIQVWDLPVRAFHWLLVAAIAVAGVTGFILGATALSVHLLAGIAVAALVGGRVIWGLLGSPYARFAGFAYAPHSVLGHVRDLLAGRAHRHLGHNPLGSMMVFGLLTVAAAIAVSGAAALGGLFKQGPLGAFLRFAAGGTALDLHQAFAWLLLAMIGGHLAGVAFESWRGHENLTLAMLTGRKRKEAAIEQPPVRSSRPLLAAALAIVLGGSAWACAAALSAVRAPGLPPATLDPVYDGACGSCHFAFSPSLNPRMVWDGIMDHLDRHFGVRVRITPQRAAAIRAYLDANAAERWDTLPAHRFRARDRSEPLRITATPYWRHVHAGIPAAVFADRAVSGRLSCNACHADAATGRFAPQAIELPDNTD